VCSHGEIGSGYVRCFWGSDLTRYIGILGFGISVLRVRRKNAHTTPSNGRQVWVKFRLYKFLDKPLKIIFFEIFAASDNGNKIMVALTVRD
jgi:hypothetical protein